MYVIDFAGSGVVHIVGGIAALQCARAVGQRMKPPRFTKDGKVKQISGNNASVASLGVLILWFCWYGFNAGGTLLIEEHPAGSAHGCHLATYPDACRLLGTRKVPTYGIAARAIINTTIAPIVASLTALLTGSFPASHLKVFPIG
jgi:Amt family ammonium transporter